MSSSTEIVEYHPLMTEENSFFLKLGNGFRVYYKYGACRAFSSPVPIGDTEAHILILTGDPDEPSTRDMFPMCYMQWNEKSLVLENTVFQRLLSKAWLVNMAQVVKSEIAEVLEGG